MTILYQCDICKETAPAIIKDGIISAPDGWEQTGFYNFHEGVNKYGHTCIKCRKTIAWLERSDDTETLGEALNKPLPEEAPQ